MRALGGLPAPFLGFAWLEQIGELFDGENTLLFIFAYFKSCFVINTVQLCLGKGLRAAILRTVRYRCFGRNGKHLSTSGITSMILTVLRFHQRYNELKELRIRSS